MTSRLQRFITSESGQAAIEYALILALISIAIIVAVEQVGIALSNTFNTLSNSLR